MEAEEYSLWPASSRAGKADDARSPSQRAGEDRCPRTTSWGWGETEGGWGEKGREGERQGEREGRGLGGGKEGGREGDRGMEGGREKSLFLHPFVLFRPPVDWMSSTHTGEGHLPY